MSKGSIYRFYFKYLSEISKLTGISKNDLHSSLKKAIGLNSLKDLDSKQLYEYVSEVVVYFSEQGYDTYGKSMKEMLDGENEKYNETQ